jgi:integrase
VANGANPQADRRAKRQEPTLGDLFAHWIEMHAKVHKRTWQEDERQYNVFLKQWAGRKLSSITKQDIQGLHARVGRDNGRYAANRLLALVRAAFNKAADIGWTGANPTAGIKKFKEQSRDRFLQVDELPRFFRALQHESDLFRDFLLTGARRSNVQSMAWADIDFHSAVWRIPETKSGHPVLVPLVRPAIGVLRARREASDDSPWVFSTRSRIGHLTEPKTAWRRVCDRAEIDGLTIHDLRRSMGSYLAITGASLPVIGKMLGHTQPSTTAVYSRLSLDPVRASVDKAVDAMVAAGGFPLLEHHGGSNGQEES